LTSNLNVNSLSDEKFLELLVNTKRPQIFAESEVHENGNDWNATELSILGDVSIAVNVIIFDNGRHSLPDLHDKPFGGTLIYVPGALLRNDTGNTPVDWLNVATENEFDLSKYGSLYEKKLLPVFQYIHNNSVERDAVVTVPGLGCGQFAGRFQGKMAACLKVALILFLEKYSEVLSNIKLVYFDPYGECDNETFEFNGISLHIRPLTKGNSDKPQLSHLGSYIDDVSEDLRLFSVVAWDHVSWPGNDFHLGSRTTDDGVKAAATDSMRVMTGIAGHYNHLSFTYDPTTRYTNWEKVVLVNKIQLRVEGNLCSL